MVLLVVNSALGRNALSAEPLHTWLQGDLSGRESPYDFSRMVISLEFAILGSVLSEPS